MLTTKVHIRVYYFSFMVFVFYSFNINTHTILSVQRLVCTKLSACSQSIIYTTLSSIGSSYTLENSILNITWTHSTHQLTIIMIIPRSMTFTGWDNSFHRNRPTYARNTVNEVYTLETTCWQCSHQGWFGLLE